jgi:hypothetical protein
MIHKMPIDPSFRELARASTNDWAADRDTSTNPGERPVPEGGYFRALLSGADLFAAIPIDAWKKACWS